MKPKGIIFDLDGTLADSLEDIADSMNAVLQELNLPIHNLDAYKYFVGNGIKKLVSRALPESHQDEETIVRCFNTMMKVYRSQCINKTKLYDGIASMLDDITSRQIKLAVLSNKADELTQKIVSELLSDWDFEFIAGLKTEEHKKPNPIQALQISEKFELNPEEIIFVGDTSVDIQTAINAGMCPVGVSWGFRSKEELISSGAKHLLDHPSELVQILD